MPIIRLEPRYNIIQILEDVRQFDHRLPYNYGQTTHILNCPTGRIPPFQLIKTNGWAWATIELVNYKTGTATDVKTAMETTGFALTEYTGTDGYGTYDVYEYPGTIELPISGISEGAHYLRMQDYDGNYVLLGMFLFMDGLENRRDYVKLEWWNLSDMILDCDYVGETQQSTAHIKYTAPFKFWMYVKSDLAMHGWQFEENAEERDGFKFNLQITRFKEWSFRFIAPEHLADAVTLIPLHDKVQVTYNGQTHERIHEFRPVPEPRNPGNLYFVECVFRTNQTTNTVNAAGLSSTAYEVAAGGCLPDATFCRAIVESGTAEYTGGYVTDEFGSNRNFLTGDYLIVEASGFLVIRQAACDNCSTYNSITEADGSNWWTDLDGRPAGLGTAGEFYFFAYSGILYDAPFRTAETPGTPWNIQGRSFGNSVVHVVLKDAEGNEWIGATVLSSDFPTTGADFNVIDNGRLATAYKIRAATWRCPNIAESDWYALEGVDYDEIADTLEVYPEGDTAPDPDVYIE